MPTRNEKIFPTPVTKEADKDLQKIITQTGLRQTEVLRHAITAALATLAKEEYVSFPIEFTPTKRKKKRSQKKPAE